MISAPDRFQAGLRVGGLTELVDLVPTLLEAADMEVPKRVQGKSLLPHLTGQADMLVTSCTCWDSTTNRLRRTEH